MCKAFLRNLIKFIFGLFLCKAFFRTYLKHKTSSQFFQWRWSIILYFLTQFFKWWSFSLDLNDASILKPFSNRSTLLSIRYMGISYLLHQQIALKSTYFWRRFFYSSSNVSFIVTKLASFNKMFHSFSDLQSYCQTRFRSINVLT